MKHAKIQKWGNSLAMRIPKTLVKELNLREGSGVLIGRENGGIFVKRSDKITGTMMQIWKRFLIPTGKKRKEHISENIDHFLYGAPRR